MNIYPSLMVVPEQELEHEIQLLANSCAGFHIDIMDGIFVPNKLWYDAKRVNEIVRLAQKVWIHLMVQNPQDFYLQLELPEGSLVSFHIESDVSADRLSKIIKEKKHRASLAMRPKTPASEIMSLLNIIDQVLVMSVDPGRSGQLFLESTFAKIDELIVCRERYNAHFAIGVDGGINKNNIQRLVQQGVGDYAVASGIFGQKDHVMALRDLQK